MQFEGVKNCYFKNRYRKGVLFSNLDSRQPLNHLLNIIYGILHKKINELINTMRIKFI